MQVSKSYEGTIASAGSASARQVSFGATGTVSNYQNRVDFVNQTIADFLRDECGVDTPYEVRDGSSYKFLWVYNIPFLFSPGSSSAYYFGFYGPYSATALNQGSNSTSNGTSGILNGVSGYSLFFANSASATAYKFTLYFDGDPAKGFILRVKCQTAAISSGFLFGFAKAANMLNGKNSVVWKYGAGSMYWNGIDLNEDGTMDADSFSAANVRIDQMLFSKDVNHTSSIGKLPLVPINVGIWKTKNIYKRPLGFGLPDPHTTATESQVAVEISGRKFLIGSNESVGGSVTYPSCGLIEMTT